MGEFGLAAPLTPLKIQVPSGKLAEEYSTQVSSAPTIAYTTMDHLGSPRVIKDKLVLFCIPHESESEVTGAGIGRFFAAAAGHIT